MTQPTSSPDVKELLKTPEKIALTADIGKDAKEVIAWYTLKGVNNSGFVGNIEEPIIYWVEQGHLKCANKGFQPEGKTIIPFSVFKSCVEEGEQEEWCTPKSGFAHYNFSYGKWYKVVRRDGNKVYFIGNDHYGDCCYEEYLQFSFRSPTTEETIIGYRHKALKYEIEYLSKNITRNLFNVKYQGCEFELPEWILNEDFEPIYKQSEIVLILGTCKIKIEISKDSIKAEGKEWSARKIESMLTFYEPNWNGHAVKIKSWEIGGCVFQRKELEEILQVYNSLTLKK